MTYPGPRNLPPERVSLGKSFEITGVNYTGAVIITGEGDIPKKIYICLFTCVHLEVPEDLSSETFLQLFRIFAARSSCPHLIINDIATNAIGTATFIKDVINDPEVKQTITKRQCRWKFIIPRTPWQNGFTERMIELVKNCLKKTLH